MKNLIFIIMALVVVSCDHEYNTSFILKNSANNILNIVYYSDAGTEDDQIHPNSELLFQQHSGMSGGPAKLSLDEFDSIFVSGNAGIIKYYKDRQGANQIYIFSNWAEERVNKHCFKYYFEFKDEDFE